MYFKILSMKHDSIWKVYLLSQIPLATANTCKFSNSGKKNILLCLVSFVFFSGKYKNIKLTERVYISSIVQHNKDSINCILGTKRVWSNISSSKSGTLLLKPADVVPLEDTLKTQNSNTNLSKPVQKSDLMWILSPTRNLTEKVLITFPALFPSTPAWGNTCISQKHK